MKVYKGLRDVRGQWWVRRTSKQTDCTICEMKGPKAQAENLMKAHHGENWIVTETFCLYSRQHAVDALVKTTLLGLWFNLLITQLPLTAFNRVAHAAGFRY